MKYLLFRIAQFLARHTPRRVAYWVGDFISWFHYRFNRRSRRAVMENLATIHRAAGETVEPSRLQREARQVYRNFAKYLVDFFSLFHLSDEERSKLLDAGAVYDRIREGLARGKGVLVVTAHFGNWELAGAVLCMGGFKTSAVALVQADPKMNELFQSQRLARGLQVIPMGRAAKPCLQALRRNEVVAVLGDRDFTSARVTVNFFGKPARLPHGPAQLAVASGAFVITGVLARTPEDTFRVLLYEPIVPDGLTAQDVAERIAHALENLIRQSPTQWLIFHHFWDIEEDLAITHGAPSAALKPETKTNPAGRTG